MKAPETVLLLNAPRAVAAGPSRIRGRVSPAIRSGSWRYDAGEVRRRRWPWLAMALSASLHGFVFFGLDPEEAPVVASVAEENFIELMEMPKLEDLEEPEVFDEGAGEPVDETVSYVPMLADLPAAVQVDSFVQALDFSTLDIKPDFSNAKIVAIPPGVRRVGPGTGEGLKNIFNLADLDRAPEPVFQPSPVFPPQLRREVSHARVDVEFVVGVDGKVLEVRIVHASIGGFEEAAIAGVSRWQFRAGMKGGRKVNTRMRVPILFRVVEGV